jgi:hypothetical protein
MSKYPVNIQYNYVHCRKIYNLFVRAIESRDVNRFWSSRRKLKTGRQIDADSSAVRRVGALYGQGSGEGPPRSSGINGAKSCILGLSWHFISLLKFHFFVLFFSYIFFFYIFLHFSNYLSILCFLKKPSSESCLHLCLYRRNVYNFVKRHSELIAIFLKKLEKKQRICNPNNSVPLRLRFHLQWVENNDWYYSG